MAEIIFGMGMQEAKDRKWLKHEKSSSNEMVDNDNGLLDEVKKMNHRQRYRAVRREVYMHSAQERFWLIK